MRFIQRIKDAIMNNAPKITVTEEGRTTTVNQVIRRFMIRCPAEVHLPRFGPEHGIPKFYEELKYHYPIREGYAMVVTSYLPTCMNQEGTEWVVQVTYSYVAIAVVQAYHASKQALANSGLRPTE